MIRLKVGCRDEGLNMLHIAYEAGKAAGYPDADKVKAIMESI